MTNQPDLTVLDPVPFRVDLPALLRTLHMADDAPFVDDLVRVAREAESVARPKGVYRLVGLDDRADDSVTIDGICFTSRVLAVNLDGLNRAFPYVATCGEELEAWSLAAPDPLQQFWMDAIKEQALGCAIAALGDHLDDRFQTGKRSSMNPGSLADWPLSEQHNLFRLFGDVSKLIGVRLTESCLMAPVKSVSGIWFQTEKGFQNCQLCPRSECPNRRAPHDPGLFDRAYRE
ncbi:MAG: vitamin B12 dependent methionine synthase [bacterium]|nr:vitamin B12 dependent methionine synthase [bacterium]